MGDDNIKIDKIQKAIDAIDLIGQDCWHKLVDEKRDPDFDLKREMFFVANKLRENSLHIWSRAIKEDSDLIEDLMIRSERDRKDAMIIFCAIMGMEYGDVD